MMAGFYGTYDMSREASGTSWQPEATPMEGIHLMHGEWMFMFHGFADLVYTDQGGRRGEVRREEGGGQADGEVRCSPAVARRAQAGWHRETDGPA